MSRLSVSAGLVLAVSVGLTAVTPAQAKSPLTSVVVGRVTSQKTCTLYQESAGHAERVITRHVYAESESWRTWLVKDCVTNFATIRTSLEAALASSGKFSVKRSGKGFTVSGVVGQVGGSDAPLPRETPVTTGFSVASRDIFASMDITLRDPAGRMIYGGLLTKHLETSSTMETKGFSSYSNQSGEAVYTQLQHELALAAARLVAFHIEPLRVTSVHDRQIELNYGSPLLTLGTIVDVAGPSGATRYYVTSASPDGATAQLHGETGDWTKVGPGSMAAVIEPDDAAANARTINRVELPE
jgi:hypothetical protein